MATAADLALLIRVRNEGTEELERFQRNLEHVDSRFESMPGHAAGVGIAIAGLVSGVALLSAKAFELGESFDAAFDTITIKSGATGQTLATLQDDFRAVVADVPASFADASTAIGLLHARTDQLGEGLQNLAKQELELARLTKTDIGENIRSTARLFGDWSIATEDQALTLDKLFVAAQKSGGSVSELSQLADQFGAPMRQLGITFDEGVSLMAKWEKEGVNVETVATTMRLALAKFAEAGVDPKEMFHSLVADIAAMEDPLAAASLAMEVFGKRGGADMAAAIREGRFAVDDWMDTLAGAGGAIKKTADDTDDAKETMVKAWNQVALAAEPIGTLFFEIAGAIAQHVEPVMKTFAEDLNNIAGALKAINSGASTWQELFATAMGADTGRTPQQPKINMPGLKSPFSEFGAQLDSDEVAPPPAPEPPPPTEIHDAAWWRHYLGLDKAREHVPKVVHEVAQLTQAAFQEAFAQSEMGASFGPGKGLFDAITKAAVDGGQSNIDALARQAAEFKAMVLKEFSPDEAEQVLGQFFDLLGKAVASPTAEARAAVADFVGTTTDAKKMWTEWEKAGTQAAERLNLTLQGADEKREEAAAEHNRRIAELQQQYMQNAANEAATATINDMMEQRRYALERDVENQRRHDQDAMESMRLLAQEQDRQLSQVRRNADSLTGRSREDRDANIQNQRAEADALAEHTRRLNEIAVKGGPGAAASVTSENESFKRSQEQSELQLRRSLEDRTRARADQDSDRAMQIARETSDLARHKANAEAEKTESRRIEDEQALQARTNAQTLKFMKERLEEEFHVSKAYKDVAEFNRQWANINQQYQHQRDEADRTATHAADAYEREMQRAYENLQQKYPGIRNDPTFDQYRTGGAQGAARTGDLSGRTPSIGSVNNYGIVVGSGGMVELTDVITTSQQLAALNHHALTGV